MQGAKGTCWWQLCFRSIRRRIAASCWKKAFASVADWVCGFWWSCGCLGICWIFDWALSTLCSGQVSCFHMLKLKDVNKVNHCNHRNVPTAQVKPTTCLGPQNPVWDIFWATGLAVTWCRHKPLKVLVVNVLSAAASLFAYFAFFTAPLSLFHAHMMGWLFCEPLTKPAVTGHRHLFRLEMSTDGRTLTVGSSFVWRIASEPGTLLRLENTLHVCWRLVIVYSFMI